MSRPRIDVYEFIKIHDELNHLHNDNENNEFNKKKNDFYDSGEYREGKEFKKKRNKFDDFRVCNDCIEFCEKGRDDFDAIRAIHESLSVINEALRDIEKNRICEGIRDIIEGIRDTKEGVNDIVRTLNKIFE